MSSRYTLLFDRCHVREACRTGLMNGWRIKAGPDDVYELTEGVAAGRISKAAVAVWFEQHLTR